VYVPVPTELTAATHTRIHVAAVPVTRPLTLVVAEDTRRGDAWVKAPVPAGLCVVVASQGPLEEPALSTYILYPVMAAPPLLEGADHEADQSRLEPLSKDVAVSELTVPGTVVVATAGPTCAELASADVPAELLAVANALKKFGTSADTMV